VRSLAPDLAAIAELMRRIDGVGVAVFGRAHAADYRFAVRAFCPGHGIAEDPVTGSAAAALGFFLRESGEFESSESSFGISQGREIGRDGRIEVNIDAHTDRVEIGGQSVTCIDGALLLPGG
jgi:PhzF family phenazine biosynthesis protein